MINQLASKKASHLESFNKNGPSPSSIIILAFDKISLSVAIDIFKPFDSCNILLYSDFGSFFDIKSIQNYVCEYYNENDVIIALNINPISDQDDERVNFYKSKNSHFIHLNLSNFSSQLEKYKLSYNELYSNVILRHLLNILLVGILVQLGKV